MESATDLDRLATGLHGLGHPIRVQALVLLEFESTPRDLAEIIGEPLGVVSYHVRMLVQYELVTLVRTEPRRGALAHFYVRSKFATELLGKLNGSLNVPKRPKGRPSQARRDALATWVQQSRTPAQLAA
jgi:DNA-binding transcriptional ArsR family regulator